MSVKLHRCPDCGNNFVQPFTCSTCGAQKLYDQTVYSQAQQIAVLESRLAKAEAALRRLLNATAGYDSCSIGQNDEYEQAKAEAKGVLNGEQSP